MATVGTLKSVCWSRGVVRGERIVCHYKWMINKTKGYFNGEDPFDFLTTTLLAQIVLIFLVSRATYFLVRHFQQNLITAQIIVISTTDSSELQKRAKDSTKKTVEETVIRRSSWVRVPPRDNPALAFLKCSNEWKEDTVSKAF